MSTQVEPNRKASDGSSVATIAKPAVFPYFAEKATFPPDILNLIYRKLAAQDLLADLVHEKHISEDEFVEFVDKETLAYLLMDLSTKEYVGIGWVTQTEESDQIKKGFAAFAFFREFHTMALTSIFGKMALSHWFNLLNYDIIWGLTPATNKAAKRYCERIGLKYVASLPNFTSRRGQITDGLICMITRDQFNEQLAQEETHGPISI